MQADEEKVITGWARINGGLSILQISLSNFDLYAWFFFPKESSCNSLQNLMKRALATDNYEIISDQHYNAPKWPTFKAIFFILTVLRHSFDHI